MYLDGVELWHVTAASVSKGRVRVVNDPIKTNRRGKIIIRVEPI